MEKGAPETRILILANRPDATGMNSPNPVFGHGGHAHLHSGGSEISGQVLTIQLAT